MNLGESGNRSNDAIETARKEGETGVVVLLEQFEENSAETRHAVRVELGWYDEMAAEVFALVVFVSDGLLRIQPRRARNRISRFLKIAQGLPLELQMVLCNRLAGSPKDIVDQENSEMAFKNLSKRLTLHHLFTTPV